MENNKKYSLIAVGGYLSIFIITVFVAWLSPGNDFPDSISTALYTVGFFITTLFTWSVLNNFGFEKYDTFDYGDRLFVNVVMSVIVLLINSSILYLIFLKVKNWKIFIMISAPIVIMVVLITLAVTFMMNQALTG